MKHLPLISSLFASGLLCWGATATSAAAQALEDRFWFEASAFKPNIDTHVQVSPSYGMGAGTDISLESDLNLADRETLPDLFLGARLGSRWTITGEYFALDREGSVGLQREIVFDDVTYPVGVTLNSAFDTSVYRLSAAYSFIHNDRAEVGVSLGAHVTTFDLQLEGKGYIGSASLQALRRERDVLAPLPTLGLYAGYRITPRLSVGGRFDYMSLGVGDYDGELTNAQATISWQLFRNVGVGAMYRYVDYGLQIDKEKWTGDMSYQFSGPAVFLRVGF
ncbi:hypothetical protein [Brevundimonas goettingensis]|uniref:Outer membrane protein beta-barrel domain-containing protein n=1 Tax=Brevundimonas goettingensis TaxID=2774190 RepID=A0A975GXM8_9CAUL|nr:hypothetical protein [Brevundimonas goettingensis]QTC90700.1 hypothetical protein IFJ75_15880 [Brevundimonas goettingensis]